MPVSTVHHQNEESREREIVARRRRRWKSREREKKGLESSHCDRFGINGIIY